MRLAAAGRRSARSRGAGDGSERRAEPAASSSPPSPGAGSAPPHAATSLSAIGRKGGAETGGLGRGEEGAGARRRDGFFPEPVTQVRLAAGCISPARPRPPAGSRCGKMGPRGCPAVPGETAGTRGRIAAASPLRGGLEAAPEAELKSTKRTEMTVLYIGCRCVSRLLCIYLILCSCGYLP